MILSSIIYVIFYYPDCHIYVGLHARYLTILLNGFRTYIINNFMNHCRLILIPVIFRNSKFYFLLIVAQTRYRIKNQQDKEEIVGNSYFLRIKKIVLK